MNKKLIGKIVVLALVIVMLGTFIKQQVERSETVNTSSSYEVNLTDETGVKEGQLAPNFQLQTLDGKTVELSDYKGQNVIVNFWATWCNPCRTEMPHMQKFYEKNAQQMDVEILALNLTYDDRGAENVQSFVNSYDLTFPIVLMENDTLLTDYEVLTIPSTIFIDKEGRVQTHIAGAMDQEKLIYHIEQLN